MQENKLIKILIPIVALVVVFESIMLVSNLSKGSQVVSEDVGEREVKVEKEAPVADFVFRSEAESMKVGKTYKVELNLIGKKDFALDGIQVYIKYNPKLVTISKLVKGTELPEATVSRIDSNKGMIENIFLIEENNGFKTKASVINQIVSFNITPKLVGNFELELSNDTKIVDTSAKSLSFLNEKLEVKVIK